MEFVVSEKEMIAVIRKYGNRATVFLVAMLLICSWGHFRLIDEAIAHQREMGLPVNHIDGFIWPGIGIIAIALFHSCLYVFQKVLVELLVKQKS
jgi:hypothetical protein